MDQAMKEIVTCEGDLGISTLTNRSGETTLTKRRCVDDGEEEEEVDQ
jgi:alpha-acetolactate decarboxylase